MNVLKTDPLARATCALIVGEGVVGTAWLIDNEGHLLTAGHLLGRKAPTRNVKVRFLDDRPRDVSVVYWNVQEQTGIDCAVLRLDYPFIGSSIRPLPIRLTQTASGAFRVRGYGTTLGTSSEGGGTFLDRYYPLDTTANALFRLDSKELGEGGFSGAPVYSVELSAAVAIQIEGAEHHVGPGRDTILAMPLDRVAGLWPKLYEIVSPLYEETPHY